ncbi:MAG: type 4a pilus biogenesis protein PilO [Patescibacteria group bacterium]
MAVDYKNSLARYRKYLQVAGKRPLFRATLFVILSLLLLIILVFFALRPTFTTIGGLVGDIRTKKEILARLDAKISNMQKMVSTYQGIQNEIYLLDEALPIGSQFSVVGNYLQSIGAENINLSDINLSSGTLPTEGLSEIGFSLSVTGSFSQIRDSLSKIENSRRLMSVTDVLISKNPSGILNANIKGTAYFVFENYEP